jgi:hypothetical protein
MARPRHERIGSIYGRRPRRSRSGIQQPRPIGIGKAGEYYVTEGARVMLSARLPPIEVPPCLTVRKYLEMFEIPID